MSLEHHPARSEPASASDYWQALIYEKAAADFLGVKDRTLQAYRHRGGGPRYIALSRRCLRYRRIDLRLWVEARMRASTSEAGPEAHGP